MRSNSQEYILGLRTSQLVVFRSPARFRILVAGRRFGKTQLALIEMLIAAQTPGAVIWYVAPSYRQAKAIAWDRIKRLTCPYWAKKPSETDLKIWLIFGSVICLKGADRPDSLRGNGLNLVVTDEYASMRPKVWEEVLRPALSDRGGRALFISTPKGLNHFHDLVEFSKSDPESAVFHFTTADGGIVDQAELQSATRQLDSETYRQEFLAEFLNGGHETVYYAFNREKHCKPLKFENLYPLIWTLDFNVNPMCMLLVQRIGDIVHVLDEIILHNTNTEAACVSLVDRITDLHKLIPAYQRPLPLHIYGDASGNHRRTSASSTDWNIIRQFFARYKGQIQHSVHTNNVNPAVRDRVNCVNSRLLNTEGDIRVFIDPRCQELIRDLEKVIWKLDPNGQIGTEIDKKDPNRTHASDALGYYIAQAFPLKPIIGGPTGRLYW